MTANTLSGFIPALLVPLLMNVIKVARSVVVFSLKLCNFMPTRREFLLNCTTLAAGVAIAPVTVFGGASPITEVSLDSIHMGMFIRQVNTTFTVIGSEGAMIDLMLTKVQTPQPSKTSSLRRADSGNEKFSLTFRGSLDQPLDQNTYLFTHNAIGCFSIFIVPIVVNDQEYCYYEAVFNRPGRQPSLVVSPKVVARPGQRTSSNQ